MTPPTIAAFLGGLRRAPLRPGVVTVLAATDGWLAEATLAHLGRLGTGPVLVLGPGAAGRGVPGVRHIACALDTPAAVAAALNALIDGLAGRWIAWCQNAEFLFYPFCETRTLDDLATFLGEERRRVLFSYALDLYAPRLPGADEDPTALGLMFDGAGYHAFPQADQRLDLYGGLGWRFEELMPADQQPLGRPALFLAERGVHLTRALMFTTPDHGTVACPWHHNPTGAVMSLRRARLLMAHPGYPPLADRLVWRHSVPFDWTSRQLLDRGLIEPGQWF